MNMIRQWLRLALFALLAILAAPALHAETAPASGSAQTQQVPQTNAEIRQWYNDQVAVIPKLDAGWIEQGLSPERRARQAYDIRHHARIQARAYMQDKQEVAQLQARDQEKYGNPDGPTFDYLVAQNVRKGLQGAAVYEEIIGSSNRTNAEYNARFNVTPTTGQ